MRRLVVLGVMVFLLTAPAYGDLFVQTVGDIDAMVDQTYTSFDVQANMDSLVYAPGSESEWIDFNHPQVNDLGSVQWEFLFESTTSVAEMNGATLGIAAWDVRWDDAEVVTIASDGVSYVLGGLDHFYQGGCTTFVPGVTTGSAEYGTLDLRVTTFTLTAEQVSSLFTDTPSATVTVSTDVFDRSVAIDYATITIDYTPGAEPVHAPEPASMIMLGALGAGLAGARKLRRKK